MYQTYRLIDDGCYYSPQTSKHAAEADPRASEGGGVYFGRVDVNDGKRSSDRTLP